ncbi:glycerophosphodiester phosphodiesterase family protein [Sphingobacterium alkalisoli]|uniref:Glycerophosphodiester phosphodiesterase family protein n=1 Tax=Sphingobacterium alkalisoli TaxID=1874115 RepID=A0A4U0H2N8_9SPHI|nr:glycerophosphodiester phosphodiesterase family protein [Sphingobacterium alkalisoli]TJY65870.1 glycerophosphodiester phosphodiesterase family protein [Sphingobacterium alkalisoli]GGH17760.1 glycerophosphoryl diester phosphodiesterase [Sphingobacterium alkalisoli]
MTTFFSYIRLIWIISGLMYTTVYAQSTRLLAKLEQKNLHFAAHRGSHQQFPENSVPAIQEAISLGITIVELDVRSTKDGVLILMHDKTVDRTTTGKGKVSELTYAEIQQLQLRETPQGIASKYHIPTLQEALGLCKGKIILDIDFKEERKEYIAQTYELIANEGMEDEVLFFLYDHQEMEQVYRLNPKITLFPRARSMKDISEILQSKRTHIIHIDESFDAVEQLAALRSQGVYLWINSLGEMDKQAAEKGSAVYQSFLKKYPYVTIIQTDNPALWSKTRTTYKNN